VAEIAHAGHLPRGRHHLTREQVAATQRGRMLLAMTEAVAEKGYADTTVADVIARAGTSRETFYQQFANKQDCFLEAADEGAKLLIEKVGTSVEVSDGTPLERFDRLLLTYLQTLDEEPALARTLLIDVFAAGPDAMRRRVAVQRRFAALLVEVLAGDERLAALPDRGFASEAFVGAVSALVTARLIDGQDVISLRGPIREMFAALLGGSLPRRGERRATAG